MLQPGWASAVAPTRKATTTDATRTPTARNTAVSYSAGMDRRSRSPSRRRAAPSSRPGRREEAARPSFPEKGDSPMSRSSLIDTFVAQGGVSRLVLALFAAGAVWLGIGAAASHAGGP